MKPQLSVLSAGSVLRLSNSIQGLLSNKNTGRIDHRCQMELIQESLSQPIPSPSIQGDPASYRFGLFLCGTLTFVTIGAIVGIVAGNISHYRYFDTMNFTNISINISSFSQRSSYLWLSTSDRSRKSLFSSRKIRSSWSFGKKPPNNRRW